MKAELEIEMLNDLSATDKLVLLLTKYHRYIKPTRLQKIALIVYSILEKKVPKDKYGAYFFGGFSDEIEESADALKEEGLIEYIPKKGFILTSEGKELSELIEKTSKNKENIEIVRKIVESLKDLSDGEIVALTYTLFPELTTKSVIKDTPEIKKMKNMYLVKIKKEELSELLNNSSGDAAYVSE